MATNCLRTPKITTLLLTAMVSMNSISVLAVPKIQSATITKSETGDQIVTIKGTGFGEKPQAAPILFDHVDTSYENGIINTEYQKLTNGDKVPAASKGQPSVWAGVSSGAWGSFTPEIASDESQRHDQSQENYLLLGHNSTIGNPVAYGGTSGWDTPVDNKQLYVAWWFKPKYEPQWYWRITPTNQTGKFLPEETLDIGGIASATFIGIDEDGQINLVFHKNPPNTSDLKGKSVIGLSSKAQSTFPENFVNASGIGFENPGSQKYIRVWEDPNGKTGIRVAWTQMHLNIDSIVEWTEAPVKGNEWNLMEFEVDSKRGFARARINSQELATIKFDPSIDYKGRWSPTVALMGLNGKVGKLQESHLDDIYIDDSLQRIIIGDSATLKGLTHSELQRPLSWTDNEIKFELLKGSFKNIENSFIYIFDTLGNANSTGRPICTTCDLPPEKIKLHIE